jgi:hypothetical protein
MLRKRRLPKTIEITPARVRAELLAALEGGGGGGAGPPGPPGDPGAQGDPGPQGDPGTDGADGAAWTVYSATLNPSNTFFAESTVAHVGMTSSALLRAWLKPGDDFDENNGEGMPEVTVAARGATDQVVVTLMSGIPMSGPVKIAYEVLA